MDLRCGTRISLSAVRNPHMKKSVVIMAMAGPVFWAGVAATLWLFTVAMAIEWVTLLRLETTVTQSRDLHLILSFVSVSRAGKSGHSFWYC